MRIDRHTGRRPGSGTPGHLLTLLTFLKPYATRVLAAVVALLFTTGITLLMGQGLRWFIDNRFAPGSPAMTEDTGVMLLALLAFMLLQGVATFSRFYLVSWIGERVAADIRYAVYRHIMTLHPAFFESNSSGEIQSRITTDSTLLQLLFSTSLPIALRNLLLLLGGLAFLFAVNPKLSSIAMICSPLVVVPMFYFGRRVRKLSRVNQDRIASVGAFVGERVKHIKTVQACNGQDTDLNLFSRYVESAFNAGLARNAYRAALITAVLLIVFCTLAVLLWVGSRDVMAGVITAGELAAYAFYAAIVAAAVRAISEVAGDLQQARGATERLMELLGARSLLLIPERPQRLPEPFEAGIELRRLTFHYPSRPNHAALDEVSLHIPAGTSLALVGPSGAGKSTLFDLLLRFYDPQQGGLYLGGVDIRNLDPVELRRHIAVVPQQPALFTGNIIDNIRYGRPGASEEEVRSAADAAFATEFIERLPSGFASFLGEAGARLSEGQRQRIVIARAILKNPGILLLDEATSALDADSEHRVQQALTALMRGRTTLIIAHRLSTVTGVDRIAVMDRGRLVASGSHAELLQSSPLYAKLSELQFRMSSPEQPAPGQ